MAEAGAVRRRAASRELKAARSTARRMAEAGAARRRAASSLLEVIRNTASRMAVAGGARRRAASREPKGGTSHCKAHGGGRRCQHEGCLKAAQGGTLH